MVVKRWPSCPTYWRASSVQIGQRPGSGPAGGNCVPQVTQMNASTPG